MNLEETVHVASGALILEPDIAGVLLGVPTDPMRSVGIDLDLEGDGVVLDVALLRVQDFVPGHVV